MREDGTRANQIIQCTGCGKIDKEELSQVMTAVFSTMDGQQIDSLFAAVDKDKDGYISQSKFLNQRIQQWPFQKKKQKQKQNKFKF